MEIKLLLLLLLLLNRGNLVHLRLIRVMIHNLSTNHNSNGNRMLNRVLDFIPTIKSKSLSRFKCFWPGTRSNTCIYRLQIPALVPEIFKFEKCVKYANEMTDDVIHSTQYYIICVNKAILANFNLQCRSLKRGRLIVL